MIVFSGHILFHVSQPISQPELKISSIFCLTIIPQARVGYETIDSQLGATQRVGYNGNGNGNGIYLPHGLGFLCSLRGIKFNIARSLPTI